ncbi:ATP-binding protein [Actinoallomurus acanthiterrae]
MADAGIGHLGQFVGHNMLGGRSFAHDPWDWYDAGVTTNPNMMIFGEIGSRKSTLVKTMIARGFEFGRDAFVTDVKSEYSDLAAFLGYEPIFLGPGLGARLNPFDPGSVWETERDVVTERQLAMLVALGTAVLDRPMSQSELTLCKIAIAAVTDGELEVHQDDAGDPLPVVTPARRLRIPVLPEVVEAMMRPAPQHVERLPLDWGALRENTADLIMGFQRLIDGDLRSMFDEPTNIDADPSGRFLAVNLSRVLEQRRQALPLVRICATSWLQSALTRRDGRRRLVVADEAWADLTLGTLRWYQSSFKLTRRDLAANVLVFHKPGDLLTAGDAGSERERLAEALVADTGTTVFYRQRAQQIPLLRAYYGINAAEEDVLRALPPGQALWKVGESRSAVVQHVRSPIEATFTNTDPAAADTARDSTPATAPGGQG